MYIHIHNLLQFATTGFKIQIKGLIMKNKLKISWCKKEKDILVTYPLGIKTNCDASFLYNMLEKCNFVEEVKNRGYDIKSIKFSIEVDKNNERYKTKFPTLSKGGLDHGRNNTNTKNISGNA